MYPIAWSFQPLALSCTVLPQTTHQTPFSPPPLPPHSGCYPLSFSLSLYTHTHLLWHIPLLLPPQTSLNSTIDDDREARQVRGNWATYPPQSSIYRGTGGIVLFIHTSPASILCSLPPSLDLAFVTAGRRFEIGEMSGQFASEHVCYVNCNYCNTILVV